jgi:hypothetical protein
VHCYSRLFFLHADYFTCFKFSDRVRARRKQGENLEKGRVKFVEVKRLSKDEKCARKRGEGYTAAAAALGDSSGEQPAQAINEKYKRRETREQTWVGRCGKGKKKEGS